MPENTLTITDNRTNKTYTVPVENGTIRAMDLRQIKTGADDFGLMTYDPAFMNTASCKSAITYIDGDKGILRYRGYPIEVLAERCTFLEVAYLLLRGELPTEKELKAWVYNITHHTMLHETTKKFMEGFRYSSHPMSMFVSTIAALVERVSGRQGCSRSGQPPASDFAADREGALHRGHVVPAQRGVSLRLSRQRSELHRKFHEHVVEDGRAQIRGPARDCARSRHSCLFCTPTTSRTAAPTPCGR